MSHKILISFYEKLLLIWKFLCSFCGWNRHFSCWTLSQIRCAFFTKIWKVRNPYKFWTDWIMFIVLTITCYWNIRFLYSWYRWKQDSESYDFSNYDKFRFYTSQYQFWFFVWLLVVWARFWTFELVKTLKKCECLCKK